MVRAKFHLTLICLGLLIVGVWRPVRAQEATQAAPVLKTAKVPTYPRAALLAHIQGIVKIRVTTDGKRVSSLEASGPPMLVGGAKENILTWEFEDHLPTTFVTVFKYDIQEPARCELGNAIAVLHIPEEVRISANGVKTCDPAKKIQSSAKRNHP